MYIREENVFRSWGAVNATRRIIIIHNQAANKDILSLKRRCVALQMDKPTVLNNRRGRPRITINNRWFNTICFDSEKMCNSCV